MIPEIGHFALILALFVALALGKLGVICLLYTSPSPRD